MVKVSYARIKAICLILILSCFIGCQNKGLDQLPLLVSYDFQDGQAEGWQPNIPQHWRVFAEDGSMVYQLVSPGEFGEIRAPTSWSVLPAYDVSSFVFSGRLKCHAELDNKHRDMCLFFHYQDLTHFCYVHFSASSDAAHNIIGLVNGADRIKINLEPAGKSVFRLTDKEWHEFKLTCDASTGEIQAFLDDMKTPILTAHNPTLRHGLVGIGSFDDTGSFDNIILWGKKTSR